MPDVTEVLTADHRKVEQMFVEYEQNHDLRLASQICRELEIHTAVEEELVYPRLARIDQPLEQHAEQEHGQAKQLIEQIRRTQDGQTAQLMHQLQEAVQHHVREEEGKAFPEMRERLGSELSSLGQQVEQRKQQLMQER